MQWNDEIKLTDVIMIFAVLFGPLIGIQVQKWIEKRDYKRQRREFIFRTLMATRRTTIAVEHVQALNLIDVDFYGKDEKSKAVLSSWKAYHAHLSNHEMSSRDYVGWLQKTSEKLFDLLEKMAIALGFEIDRTHLESVAYLPEAHGRSEEQKREILDNVNLLLKGKINIPVRLIEE
jgi:hypothetical protein